MSKGSAEWQSSQILRGEELKHRARLEEAYARQFPDVELVLPAQSLVPRVDAALESEVSVPELLALAMEAEQARVGNPLLITFHASRPAPYEDYVVFLR